MHITVYYCNGDNVAPTEARTTKPGTTKSGKPTLEQSGLQKCEEDWKVTKPGKKLCEV
jgi:hypothetical protein